eukprot:TRINITY_DN33740_c0_g1_i1.p1 TRINITY_DN33740_c0_g1~~TRINITY_DN33740_c0_g1_i1.p1  ORF type:complete len:233 (-),score=23.95 TRINITY_DN33740_c0_g1_i1:18-665(-)
MALMKFYDGESSGSEARSRSRSPYLRKNAFLDEHSPEPDVAKQPYALCWPDNYCSRMCMNPVQLKMQLDEPLVIQTGCSCTGAPVHALIQLVGEDNIVEPFGSEKHAMTRTCLEANYRIGTLYHDISGPRLGGASTSGRYTPPHPGYGESGCTKPDFLVIGFVCKAFSGESSLRWSHRSVASMFEEDSTVYQHVRTFLEASRAIQRFRPRLVLSF